MNNEKFSFSEKIGTLTAFRTVGRCGSQRLRSAFLRRTFSAARSEKNSYVGVKASVASVRFVWRGLRFTMRYACESSIRTV